MNKSEFIKCLRDLVSEGRTEDALDLLFDNINEFARYFANDVVMLKSQYHSAKGQFLLNGIIENAEFSRVTAKVNLAILELADKIEKKSEKFDVQRKGHLLHQIPSTMVKDRETKCIIRIAYFLEHLYIGLTVDADTVVQVIQVTGLMSVELVDDNEIKTFEIRTSTDEEQFIIQDECTQWIFKVRPLRVGNFPLLLKIGAVEVINGKERKRNIIVEKEINITIEKEYIEESKFEIIYLENERYLEDIKKQKEEKYRELEKLERKEKERIGAIEAQRKREQEAERRRKAEWEEEMSEKIKGSRMASNNTTAKNPLPKNDHQSSSNNKPQSSSNCLGVIIFTILLLIILLYFFLKK